MTDLMKRVYSLTPKLLVLIFALAIFVAVPALVLAEAPEDKGAMIPTADFPEPPQSVAEKNAPETEEATGAEPDQYGCYDPYESNDTRWSARPLYDGQPQRHAFCHTWDRDYMRFYARAAVPYEFETYNLGWNADTVLELYDAWGRRLTWDDDGGHGLASRIEWTAPYNGTFYLMARQYDPYRAGAGTDYTVVLREFSYRCQALGCGDYVVVNRGCGAHYTIGQSIRVYINVESGGHYRLTSSTYWGTRTVWSGYLGAATYYLDGWVGSPGGPHTLTLHDGWMNPTCTFYATTSPTGAGNAVDPAAGTADLSAAEDLPEAQPLELDGVEW